MKLPVAQRDCGPLLELGQLRRQLRLGAPIAEGPATIAVEQIIGTVNRAQDFDGCFRALNERLAKRLRDIQAANPTSLDEPIEVVRWDRAYFVSDGHKRVAIAKRTGREFRDARVSRLPSPYELTGGVDEDAIERTAREGEFRRHTGLAESMPQARFALGDIGAYGELLHAVQTFGYDLAHASGRVVPRGEAAAEWYRTAYLPLVAQGRDRVGRLIDACTDADIFLAMHRHQRLMWGTECDSAECAADQLLLEQQRMARDRASLAGVIRRVVGSDPPASVLPLADVSRVPEDGN
jgi:hypothetical protein